MSKLTPAQVKKNYDTFKNEIIYTPLIFPDQLKLEWGAPVGIKLENLQKTGSFKVRGAFSRMNHTPKEKLKFGVVTSSAGNHGQSLAYVCSLRKIPCTIIMPKGSPENKVLSTQKWGANIVFHDDIATLKQKAEEISKKENLEFVPSYDDENIILGQASIALEIINDFPEVEVLFLQVGGGGLFAGISLVLKDHNPKIELIAVEPEGGQTLGPALKKGKPVNIGNHSTIADGLKPPNVGPLPFEIIKAHMTRHLLVGDGDIQNAITDLLFSYKVLSEPAGATGFAALKKYKDLYKGRPTAIVLSGGNLSAERLKEWM